MRSDDPVSNALDQMTNRLNAVKALHHQVFETISDEVWGRSPCCAEDGKGWPCDTYKAATGTG